MIGCASGMDDALAVLGRRSEMARTAKECLRVRGGRWLATSGRVRNVEGVKGED